MKEGFQMTRSHSLHPLLMAVAVFLLSVLVVYALDSLMLHAREYSQATFHSYPILIFRVFIPFLVIGTALFLSWLFLARLPVNRIAAIVYLLGGAIIFSAYLWPFVGFPIFLRRTIIHTVQSRILLFGFGSLLHFLAAFWILIGAISLFRKPSLVDKQ
jgi:hypothetical protein